MIKIAVCFSFYFCISISYFPLIFHFFTMFTCVLLCLCCIILRNKVYMYINQDVKSQTWNSSCFLLNYSVSAAGCYEAVNPLTEQIGYTQCGGYKIQFDFDSTAVRPRALRSQWRKTSAPAGTLAAVTCWPIYLFRSQTSMPHTSDVNKTKFLRSRPRPKWQDQDHLK